MTLTDESQSLHDEQWMRRAIRLAMRGEGWVEPNPMVGCVLVAPSESGPGRLIGQGWHRKFGESHAEVEAIADAHRNGNSEWLAGGTAYVTLEPCCHQGKTPPCTGALIGAGIKRVVIATADPFEKVAGGGIQQLDRAGLKVVVGTLEQEARQIIAPFAKLIRQELPYVIAKWAMTLDGKIASSTGDSKWISSEASRQIVHQLRARVDAVLVGSNTVLADDPSLDARLPVEAVRRVAQRIVVDRRLRIPLDCKLVKTAGEIPVLVLTASDAEPGKVETLKEAGCEIVALPAAKCSMREMLLELGRRKITNVLVEGGSEILGACFDQDLVDEAHVFVAAKIVGGKNAISPVGGQGFDEISNGKQLADVSSKVLDGDVYLKGRVIGGNEKPAS